MTKKFCPTPAQWHISHFFWISNLTLATNLLQNYLEKCGQNNNCYVTSEMYDVYFRYDKTIIKLIISSILCIY